ncbi:uncharacterized protein LOC106664505 [Cimex lectularius]|uniref:Uncharacterized protein n=1 Tax=Cimex lectularius TaxID=79782 RepID=A0A8I6RGC9_CIMLE|nr:uncharacterized protein LOC106664505 [Cimex lectularius]
MVTLTKVFGCAALAWVGSGIAVRLYQSMRRRKRARVVDDEIVEYREPGQYLFDNNYNLTLFGHLVLTMEEKSLLYKYVSCEKLFQRFGCWDVVIAELNMLNAVLEKLHDKYDVKDMSKVASIVKAKLTELSFKVDQNQNV